MQKNKHVSIIQHNYTALNPYSIIF